MSNKKDKRNKKSKGSEISVFSKILTGWQQKRPVMFFVFGFLLLMILFYFFWQSDFFKSNIQPTIVSLNASISSIILNVFGQMTVAKNEYVSSPAFSISIARGCDAFEAMALFLSTTLAFPFSLKRKLKGMIIGLGLLFIINLIRIVTLFFAGIYSPGIFEMMHAQIWPVIIIIFATGMWIFLIRNERRERVYAQK